MPRRTTSRLTILEGVEYVNDIADGFGHLGWFTRVQQRLRWLTIQAWQAGLRPLLPLAFRASLVSYVPPTGHRFKFRLKGDHAGAPAAEQRLRRTPASHPAGRTLPGGGPNDLVRVGCTDAGGSGSLPAPLQPRAASPGPHDGKKNAYPDDPG